MGPSDDSSGAALSGAEIATTTMTMAGKGQQQQRQQQQQQQHGAVSVESLGDAFAAGVNIAAATATTTTTSPGGTTVPNANANAEDDGWGNFADTAQHQANGGGTASNGGGGGGGGTGFPSATSTPTTGHVSGIPAAPSSPQKGRISPVVVDRSNVNVSTPGGGGNKKESHKRNESLELFLSQSPSQTLGDDVVFKLSHQNLPSLAHALGAATTSDPPTSTTTASARGNTNGNSTVTTAAVATTVAKTEDITDPTTQSPTTMMTAAVGAPPNSSSSSRSVSPYSNNNGNSNSNALNGGGTIQAYVGGGMPDTTDASSSQPSLTGTSLSETIAAATQHPSQQQLSPYANASGNGNNAHNQHAALGAPSSAPANTISHVGSTVSSTGSSPYENPHQTTAAAAAVAAATSGSLSWPTVDSPNQQQQPQPSQPSQQLLTGGIPPQQPPLQPQAQAQQVQQQPQGTAASTTAGTTPQVLYMAVPSPDGRGQVLQPVQMLQVPGKPHTYVLPNSDGTTTTTTTNPAAAMAMAATQNGGEPNQVMGLPSLNNQPPIPEYGGAGAGGDPHSNYAAAAAAESRSPLVADNRSRVANYAIDNSNSRISSGGGGGGIPLYGGGGAGGVPASAGLPGGPPDLGLQQQMRDEQYSMDTAALGNGGNGGQYTPDAAIASLYAAPQRPPLDELLGQIRRLARDQVGCRLVQQALDEEGPMAASLILTEGLPFWGEAMVDPFGNYLFQKILEKVTVEERVMLVESVSSRLVNASLNLHGTRSVQKVVELCAIDEQHQQHLQHQQNGNANPNVTAGGAADSTNPTTKETAADILTKSLAPSAARLCIDSHGNHVIQRILLKLGHKHSQFVFDAVAASVGDVARHRHGCCVIQRCLDSPPSEARSHLVRRIVEKSLELMQDAYGNYVVQYVLDVCADEDVHAVCESVVGKVNLLSIQKFSSNVMEKCLERCSDRVKEAYLLELSDYERVRELMMDPFGNYVIQRALSVSTHAQAIRLVESMRPHLIATTTGGPHGQRNGGVRNTAGGRRIIAKICRRFPNFTLSAVGSTQEELYSQNKTNHYHHHHHHNRHHHHPNHHHPNHHGHHSGGQGGAPVLAAYATVGGPSLPTSHQHHQHHQHQHHLNQQQPYVGHVGLAAPGTDPRMSSLHQQQGPSALMQPPAGAHQQQTHQSYYSMGVGQQPQPAYYDPFGSHGGYGL